MYWIYEVVLAVGRPESLAAIRFAGAAWTIALVLGVASIPAILGSPLAAGLASLICVSSLTVFWSPADGLAWNAEVIGLPFVLAGTALAIAAVRRRPAERLSWLFASGVLAGCAFFVKQSLGPHAAWTALWLIVACPRSTRWRALAAFGSGVAGHAALRLLPDAITENLHEIWYSFVRYGREDYMAPVTGADVERVVRSGILERAPINFLLAASAIAILARGVSRTRGESERVDTLWWLLIGGQTLVSIPCATFTGRFFGHYFLQVDVFVAVLFALALFGIPEAGGRVARDAERTHWKPAVTAAAGIAFAIFLYAGQNQIWERLRATERFPTRVLADEPVGRWVRAHSEPDDSLFVWGVRGDIYINADRKPASRFVYCLFPSGVVPWFRESMKVQAARIVPGSQAALLADLEASRPAIIVDEGNSLMGRFMVDYPFLRAYLVRNYCLAEIVEVFGDEIPREYIPIYRRGRPGPTCRPIDSHLRRSLHPDRPSELLPARPRRGRPPGGA
jgi:hypothetical protein